MRQWLQQEVRDVMKGAELRIKDATDFVTAYGVGAMSAEEASERLSRYTARWGDAIPGGITTDEGQSNADILHRIDLEAATPDPITGAVNRLLKEGRGAGKIRTP
jgi:hypothetical protein